MTEHILDLLPEGAEQELTPEQAQIMHLIQGHITLQEQFSQLTKHVESIYGRLAQFEKSLANKLLS